MAGARFARCDHLYRSNCKGGLRPLGAISTAGAISAEYRSNHLEPGKGYRSNCKGGLRPLGAISPDFSVRRERRVISSGCESRPATVAPAGST